MQIPRIFYLAITMLFLLNSSCSRNESKSSAVRIQLPHVLVGKTQSESQKNNTLTNSVPNSITNALFALNDIVDISEINCYAVTVGGKDLNQFKMSKRQDQTEESFGVGYFFAPAGTSIELVVPSGASRNFKLFGLKGINNSCKRLNPGQANVPDSMSTPMLLAETTRDLLPGDIEITMYTKMSSVFYDRFSWLGRTQDTGISYSNIQPTASIVHLPVGQSQIFSVNVESVIQPVQFIWKLNGSTSTHLIGNQNSATLNTSTSQLGSNTIEVTATNGQKQINYSWYVKVNNFSATCNQLNPGQVCSAAGVTDIGAGSDPLTHPEKFKIRPAALAHDAQENLFISDFANKIIWYWNKTSSNVIVLGRNISANSMGVVAGNGVDGLAIAGAAIHSPLPSLTEGKMFWDFSSLSLYFTSPAANRVYKIDSAGNISHIFGGGGGASHTDGTPGIIHNCSMASGLSIKGNELFVSCKGAHRIKVLDMSTGLANTLIGDGSANSVDGSIGISRTRSPTELKFDSAGNLFWLESDPGVGLCKLRVYNTSGSTLDFMNGEVIVNNGVVVSIIGKNTGCTTASFTDLYNNFNFVGPRSFHIDEVAGSVKGFYIAHFNSPGHTVVYFNSSNSDQIVLDVNIPSKYGKRVWGDGLAGLPTTGSFGSSSRLSGPTSLSVLTDKIFVADLNNNMLQSINRSNSQVLSPIGGGAKPLRFGSEGGGLHAANQARLQFPRYANFDALKNQIIFGHSPTHSEVRILDLERGEMANLIGGGTNATFTPGLSPTEIRINTASLSGVLSGPGFVAYSQDVSPNCAVRVFNTEMTPFSWLNVLIDAIKVSPVAGLGGTCAPSSLGAEALSTTLQAPESMAFKTTTGEMLVADKNQHCIIKIEATGILSEYLGTCGSSGNVDGLISSAIRLFQPRYILSDPLHPENLFIADAGNNRIKYANFSGTTIEVAGVPIPSNYIQTLITDASLSTLTGIAAYNEQVCYSNPNKHVVKCINRNNVATNLIVGSYGQGGTPMAGEFEGVTSSGVRLNDPRGLVFDGEGNLFILDYGAHVIYKVKRWF